MLRFNKLRLQGFKSFVDPTELVIQPGLTGVVGPNGCGKSNLVEALKWVMGESSAKQMRGGAMDDVIFGGSADRPSRNMAEVVIHLDNSARVAPAAYNDSDELEVSRRIERDQGSSYRINGQDVRAKDVQLLFADAASGARSTALVSQGKIGSIISAKPQDRRMLLEEAAGIIGLHSRRHEAELRLRGAENNLSRLDDILVTLESQMQSLKKQSRQATRYRNISDLIQKAEALLYHIRWVRSEATLAENVVHLKKAEATVAERTATVANATAHQAEAAEGVPELREQEARAAAALQRYNLARNGLDEEAKRVESDRLDRVHRLEQVSHDITREQSLADDARQATNTLESERASIETSRQGEGDAIGEARAALAEASEVVSAIEVQLAELTDAVASQDAERGALERSLEDLDSRLERLSGRLATLQTQRAEAERAVAAESDLDEVERELGEAEARRESAEGDLKGAETAARVAQGEGEANRQRFNDAKVALSSLEAEEKALAGMLELNESDMWPPLVDAVSVDAGYEAALGAALGDDLNAPADEAAPVHWTAMAPDHNAPALPDGAKPLSTVVRAPDALSRRLAQVGVVEDSETGDRLARELRQGQRLVSPSGALWRWDGFTVTSGATTAAQQRLEQLTRLREVRTELGVQRDRTTSAETAASDADRGAEAATTAERAGRETLRRADNALAEVRDRVGVIRARLAEENSKLSAIVDAVQALEKDIAEADSTKREARTSLDNMPDTEALRRNVIAQREELAEKRTTQIECQGTYSGLEHAAQERARRLGDITTELESWRERREGAEERIEHLQQRTAEVKAELEELAKKPDEISARREELMSHIEGAEAKRKEVADRLAEAESRLADANKRLREAESALGAAREDRVRTEGIVEQARQASVTISEHTHERLDCAPEDLAEMAELKEGADLPELEQIERRVERLHKERDTMGPVNLRAEEESREMGEQIEVLESERADLISAIEKLRRGINELNREGRERLLTSFHEVNRHFQELFQRLFGGGQAHLKLIEADDPLESGLEIMASPPGKRMQVLSLLSGGEQALTATALLFAVFMTNPAPICVLDEVDAPLDDANVDRFCSLLEEIASAGNTRFLVITHHRMTMARVERLFGVTMAERGVSQLVSVDLDRAVELRESA